MAEAMIPRRSRTTRKALTPLSANAVNISAGKENPNGLLSVFSPNKNTKAAVPKSVASSTGRSLAEELQDVQRRLRVLSLEKEKTEELLRQRDELLKEKEEELASRGREQERLQKELKKLRNSKFDPTMSIPLVKSLREKEQEKKKSKGKAKKIKGPCPVYISWCRDQWSEIKKDNPDADFKEVSTALGAKWKSLTAEDKKPYEEKYQQEKAAYLQIVGQEKRENDAMRLLEEEQMQKTAMELLEQYIQFKQGSEKEGKKLRKEKDPLKPKKPMSAFFLFSKDLREELRDENKNVLEIAKIAGEEWKNMTEEKRASYEEIAKHQMEEYNQQMEFYKQKKLEESANLEKEEEEQKKVMKQEALQLLKKKEKTDNIIKKAKQSRQKAMKLKVEKNSDPNKPKKPASSFLLFSKEARKQLMQEQQDITKSTLAAMVSVKWKELTESEKQVWNDKAAEGMATYKRQMEEYNQSVTNAENIVTDYEQFDYV